MLAGIKFWWYIYTLQRYLCSVVLAVIVDNYPHQLTNSTNGHNNTQVSKYSDLNYCNVTGYNYDTPETYTYSCTASQHSNFARLLD